MTNRLTQLSKYPDTGRRVQVQLLSEWAALNGVKMTEHEFWLADLGTGKARPLFGRWSDAFDSVEGMRWPWRDHDNYFKVGRAPAAIITQPYGDFAKDGAELRALVHRLGLAIHTPPNPKASFWFPGRANFVVITGRSFGEVLWLDEQLTFTAHG